MPENEKNISEAKLSAAAKRQIMKILSSQGYKAYAEFLSKLNVKLVDPEDCATAQIDNKGTISINRTLNADQVSVIVRHEILHLRLDHFNRLFKWMEQHPGQEPTDPQARQLFYQMNNIAADMEISNRGYTNKDKQAVRHIMFGDEIVSGIVTEDEYPDWVDLTFEEMFDRLLELKKDDIEQAQKMDNLMKQLSKLDKDDWERIEQQIDNMRNQNQQNQSGSEEQSTTKQSSSQAGDDQDQSDGQVQASELTDNSDDQSGEARRKAAKIDKELDKLSDQAEQGAEKQDKIDRQETDSDTPFKTAEEVEEEKRQIENFKKIVSELRELGELMDQEDQEAISAEQRQQALKKARKPAKISTTPIADNTLDKFRLSLNKFIYNEVEEEEADTYSRANMSYEGSGIIMPGHGYKDRNLPLINVYWDISGSFYFSPEKTKGVEQAITSLQKYVKAGKIKMNVYYHGDEVTSKRPDGPTGNDGSAILKHIQATKPTNVIIISDADINCYGPSTVVPGAVWMLFYNDVAYQFIDNLRGKKLTKVFGVNVSGL